MDRNPGSPTHEEIGRWDRARFRLRQLVAANPVEARRAGKALADRIQAETDRVNAEKKKGIEEKLALLPIAREFVLDRDAMESASDLIVDPDNPPPGLSVIGLDVKAMLPVWIDRAYRSVGRFDIDVRHTFMNLVDHLENAASGRIGDYSIDTKIDLSSTSALDAYVHAISALWSQGKDSPEDVRASLDPDYAVVSSATVYRGLGHVVLEFLREDPAKIRTAEEWWLIAVAVLVCSHPEFDPTTVGIEGMPKWRGESELKDLWDQFWGPRSGLFDHFRDYTKHDSDIPEGWQRRFWLLAERSAEHIGLHDDLPEHSSTWLTVSAVGKITGLNTGAVTRLCNAGKLRTNDKRGRDRRIDPASVAALELELQQSKRVKIVKKQPIV